MMHRILSAKPEGSRCVRLEFQNGTSRIVDFAPVIRKGGVFAPLGDPEVFAQVSVGGDGRYISWPGELEFCADALWLESRTPRVTRRGRVAVT